MFLIRRLKNRALIVLGMMMIPSSSTAMRVLFLLDGTHGFASSSRAAPKKVGESCYSDHDYLQIPDHESISDELLEKLKPEWLQSKELLSQGAKDQLLRDALNFRDISSERWRGTRNAIIQALFFGANPDIQGKKEKSALYFASIHRDTKLITYLLLKGGTPLTGEEQRGPK